MIVWLGVAIIGALLGWGFDDYGEPVVVAVAGFIAGVIVGFIVAMVTGAIFYNGTYTVTHSPVRLESIQDGSDVRGSFFLGSGVINDVSVFTWYEQNGDNSYRQQQADADLSTVHYADGAPHYILTVKRREDGGFLGKWGLRMEANEELDWWYDFYVPRGTIKQNYTLDAK